jgi:DNA-binding transcriptional LysR family regulator
MRNLMDFYSLALFVSVARAGGLGAAQRETGVPKATLSRRLCALESALNVRLFQRTKKGVVLTKSGETLYRRSLAGLLLAEKAIDEIREDTLTNPIEPNPQPE